MRKLKCYFIIFLLANLLATILIMSCAQIVNPSGGQKDTNPPKALKYIPDSAAINFNSRTICISFNEYIQLNDLNGQLIISPPMQKMPEVKVKNKELLIKFEDSLKKNTTYTISFGNAIQDITENNSLENFQYFFSTNNYIDSLSVNGKVENAFDKQAEKGIWVMLYNDFFDSVPYKRLPAYFAKTKTDGSYRINNIKSGKYKAIALKDLNGNYKYDSPEESIAFIDKPVLLEKKNTSLDFLLFKEIPTKQFIKKATAIDFGHLLFVFNKPVEKPEIRALNFMSKKEWNIQEWNENKDTLKFWLIDVGIDTLKLEFSNNDKVIDTSDIKLITNEMMKKSSRSKFEFNITTNIREGEKQSIVRPLVFTCNHPFASNQPSFLNSKQFKLIEEKDTISQDLVIIGGKFGKNVFINQFEIQQTSLKGHSFNESKSYSFIISPNCIKDIFNLPNDTIKINFKTQEEKFYGNCKLKLSGITSEPGGIVQLTNESGNNILQQEKLTGKTELNYTYLNPGKYRVRIIYDANNNGKWDTGNYLKHMQPEKVIYYPGVINIRSNWDLDQEWKFTE